MAGKLEKATHQDATDYEGPIDTGDAHAKRSADKKKVGDMNFDNSANTDKGKVFPSGRVSESAVRELFAGVEGLSEDFYSKAATLIEGAISEKIEEIKESFATEIAEISETIAAEIEESYAEKLSAYIDYTVSSFMEENQLAIDMGIKQDIAEQVMHNVVAIVESAGIQLPEEKIDIAEALSHEMIETERALNEAVEDNIRLASIVESYQRNEVFNEVSSGLSEAKKDKLARLAENVSYNSLEDFADKVITLRESIDEGYVAKFDNVSELNEEVIVDSKQKASFDDRMASYIRIARGE